MDELTALRAMREGLPGPDQELKESTWTELSRKLDSGEIEVSSGQKRSRFRGWLALLGVVLLGAIALSPAGPATANHLKDLFTSDQALIQESESELKQISGASIKNGSAYERREVTNAQITDVAEETAAETGGAEVHLPPGVVVRIHPNPLDGIDLDQYRRFCEQTALEVPDDHTCDLNMLVQEGKIPPGDFTADDIDRIFGN